MPTAKEILAKDRITPDEVFDAIETLSPLDQMTILKAITAGTTEHIFDSRRWVEWSVKNHNLFF